MYQILEGQLKFMELCKFMPVEELALIPLCLSLSESKRHLFTHQLSLLTDSSVFIQHIIYKTQLLKIEEMKC